MFLKILQVKFISNEIGKYIVEIGNSKHSLQVILIMVRDLILKGRKRCCCHIQETPNGISFKLAHQVKERK